MSKKEVVLVFGGRKYADYYFLSKCMLTIAPDIGIVVQGNAEGADKFAKQWCHDNNVHCASVPALWEGKGLVAGTNRNSAMLLLGITKAVMFPGGTGTIDMYTKCFLAGIPVWDPCDFLKTIPRCDCCGLPTKATVSGSEFGYDEVCQPCLRICEGVEQ